MRTSTLRFSPGSAARVNQIHADRRVQSNQDGSREGGRLATGAGRRPERTGGLYQKDQPPQRGCGPGTSNGQLSRQSSKASSVARSSPASDRNAEPTPWFPPLWSTQPRPEQAVPPSRKYRQHNHRSTAASVERELQLRTRRPQAPHPHQHPRPAHTVAPTSRPTQDFTFGRIWAPGAAAEAPQWSRDGIGHAVRAPAGTMLVDPCHDSCSGQGRPRGGRAATQECNAQSMAAPQMARGPGASDGRPLTAARQRSGTTSNMGARRASTGGRFRQAHLRGGGAVSPDRSGKGGDPASPLSPKDPRRQMPMMGSRASPPSAPMADESERGRPRMRDDK